MLVADLKSVWQSVSMQFTPEISISVTSGPRYWYQSLHVSGAVVVREAVQITAARVNDLIADLALSGLEAGGSGVGMRDDIVVHWDGIGPREDVRTEEGCCEEEEKEVGLHNFFDSGCFCRRSLLCVIGKEWLVCRDSTRKALDKYSIAVGLELCYE